MRDRILEMPPEAGSPAATPIDQKGRIRAVIADPAGLAAPGYAVGIFRDGRTAEVVTVGAADVSTQRPINADTQFYAGSASKQFTALALMQLVVAGKVSLDDDVRNYLPELPQYSCAVTVAILLHHTGGIRESLALLALAGYSDIAVPTRAEALNVVLRQHETKFKPGTKFDYTNGGYLLLSEIVERVAREPFAAYVNDMVLGPLGMTRSFMLAGKRLDDANVAHGYRVEDGHVVPFDSYPLFGGSGGLMTTLNDFAKYDHDIDTGHKVWTPAITKLMMKPGRFDDGGTVLLGGSGQAYASGLVVGPDWFSHGGAARGFKTNYVRLPGKRIGIALLCNRGEVDLDERANAIITALNEGLPPIVKIACDSILGRYASEDLDVIYELTKNGDTALTVRVLPSSGGAPRHSMMLMRIGDGSFIGPELRLVLDEEANGFSLETAQVSLRFNRV